MRKLGIAKKYICALPDPFILVLVHVFVSRENCLKSKGLIVVRINF